MTINSTNTYYTKLKSYFVGEATESILNSPIVKGTFMATTGLVTIIAAAYFVKKAKEFTSAVYNRPLEAAVITAAIFATGVVVVNYPITSMVVFGAASCILLNKSLFAKIDTANKIALAIFNAQPLKAIRNLGLNSDPKVVEDVNSNNNSSILKDLNLTDLKLGDLEGTKDLEASENLNLNNGPSATVLTDELDSTDLNPMDDDLEASENLNPNSGLSATILKDLKLTDLNLGDFGATKNPNPNNDPSETILKGLKLTDLNLGNLEASENPNPNSNPSITFPQPYKFLEQAAHKLPIHKLSIPSTVSPTIYKIVKPTVSKPPLTNTVTNAYKFVRAAQQIAHRIPK